MEKKRSIHVPKGMTKDMSTSKIGADFYIDALNIRLTANDDNTLLSITNAKGNEPITLDGESIEGDYLGHAVLNNYIVIFTVDNDSVGRIYRIDVDDNYKSILLAYGNFNFHKDYPIEALPIYEKDDVRKVYWIDGKNQPRFINIANKIESGVVIERTSATSPSESTAFDFVSTQALNEVVTIKRNETTIGTHSAGALQYVLTYYNLYGQESNIFHQSSLYYISYNNRGASPEDTTVSASFTIKAENLDDRFEFVRIYSIHRTSLNVTPSVRRVIDLPIPKGEHITKDVEKSGPYVSVEGSWNSNIVYNGETRPIGSYSAHADNPDYREYDFRNVSSIIIDGKTYSALSEGTGTFRVKVLKSGETANGTLEIRVIDGRSNMISWTETETVRAASKISFTDDGSKGETIDSTIMLFVGGKEIVPQAMCHKDNTLFFGNYQEKGSIVSQTTKELCRAQVNSNKEPINHFVEYKAKKTLTNPADSGYYSYSSGLTKSLKDISTFKYLEWYRFGIQAQKPTGEWSEPIFIGDYKNDVPVYTNLPDANSTSSTEYKLVQAECSLSSDAIESLIKEGYVNIRPLVVYPSLNERECICQGILNPTVFNVEDRKTNSPWCQSSWFFRPNSPNEYTISNGPPSESPDVSVVLIATGSIEDYPELNSEIWVDFYKSNEGYPSQCRCKFLGAACANISDSSYPFHIIAVEILDSYTVSDLTSHSYTEDLDPPYIWSSSGNGGEPITQICFDGNNKIAVESKTIKEAILPTLSHLMDWNSDYTYISSTYILDMSTYIKDLYNPSSTSTYYISTTFTVVTNSVADSPGVIAEFRHWKPLPSSFHRAGEIQCNCITEGNLVDSWVGQEGSVDKLWKEASLDITPSTTKKGLNNDGYVDLFSDMFFVDQSSVTFHSPDIEFDTNTRSIDNSKLKMRIVGYVPVTSTISDVDIQTSSIQLNYRNTQALPRGFWKETVGTKGYFGGAGLISAPMWWDDEYHGNENEGGENKNQYTTAFMTYPWHRNGSLNNQNSKDSKDYRSAMLKRKIMSNLRFSYQTMYEYVDNEDSRTPIFNNDDTTKYDLSGISLFDSNEVVNSRIDGNLPGSRNINYYGNVDKIVTSSRVFRFDADHQATGYVICKAGNRFMAGSSANQHHFIFNFATIGALTDHKNGDVSSTQMQQRVGSDPISIKYKSTPHALLALQGSPLKYKILPNAHDSNGTNRNDMSASHKSVFWDSNKYSVTQKTIPVKMQYCWLWLAELYNDTVQNRFGGDSDDAIENNTWLPCGQPVALNAAGTDIVWNEGDTFYQRYDCLKTYPFTNSDTNSIVDILSFMCETRVNIDGRYDRNRGQNSNLQMSPVNFNLLNYVYSQNNNFFNYRTLDKTLFNVDTYKNYITWTKKKTPGEETDTWTNITLANVLDLDGDKGDITALRRYNNSLFAFQNRAFSQILYNENTQLTTAAGVPIEIANSGKVEGKRYVSETIGCSNKWSIAESPYGLYFMDSNNASINLFNGQLEDLTNKYGFNSWAKGIINGESWKPSFNTFRTFYDGNSKEVYFTNKDICLDFSEGIGQFTSFISYENTPAMFNVKNKFYAFKNGRLYDQNGSDYGVFFGESKPYSITYIDNQDYVYDKTYTGIEFRAVMGEDMLDGVDADRITPVKIFNLPFDSLEAKTDYQQGSVAFKPQQGNVYKSYPGLKRKFRIWRADIPRNTYITAGGIQKNDRMRNPWIYLTLKKNAKTDNTAHSKMELHDMIVDYYV